MAKLESFERSAARYAIGLENTENQPVTHLPCSTGNKVTIRDGVAYVNDAHPLTPEDAAAFIANEMARLAKAANELHVGHIIGAREGADGKQPRSR